MLLLMFRSGEGFYAFDAKRVAEVVPKVALRAIPHSPEYLAGLLSFRGRAVPVIDFGRLVGGSSAPDLLSSRIILNEFTAHDGHVRLIGVVAESVSHLIKFDDTRLVSSEMSLDEAPYLGAVLQHDEGLVQLVAADKLMTVRMQEALYGGPQGSG